MSSVIFFFKMIFGQSLWPEFCVFLQLIQLIIFEHDEDSVWLSDPQIRHLTLFWQNLVKRLNYPQLKHCLMLGTYKDNLSFNLHIFTCDGISQTLTAVDSMYVATPSLLVLVFNLKKSSLSNIRLGLLFFNSDQIFLYVASVSTPLITTLRKTLNQRISILNFDSMTNLLEKALLAAPLSGNGKSYLNLLTRSKSENLTSIFNNDLESSTSNGGLVVFSSLFLSSLADMYRSHTLPYYFSV